MVGIEELAIRYASFFQSNTSKNSCVLALAAEISLQPFVFSSWDIFLPSLVSWLYDDKEGVQESAILES